MQSVGAQAEAARQIVEFEELVTRLDRINDIVAPRPSSMTTSTSTSVPSPSPPARASRLVGAASSLPYDPVASDATCDDAERVRVHIGIDEDLRMILEMDPSIVDGTLGPVISSSNHPTVTQSLRATRPQGWYCTDRDFLLGVLLPVIPAHYGVFFVPLRDRLLTHVCDYSRDRP